MKETPQAANHVDDEYRRTPFERVKSFLLGDDVFISYARGDSSDYATVLANLLGRDDFLCYLDQYGTDIDDEIPWRLKLKLWRSTVFVLVGSRAAVESNPIRVEVELFKKTERAIIPIDVDGAFKDTDLYRVVRGLPIANDSQPTGLSPADTLIEETGENLRRAEPSPKVVAGVGAEFKRLRRGAPSRRVVERIHSTFVYTRRRTWQRRMLVGSALFILVSLGVAGFFFDAARGADLDALASKERAKIVDDWTGVAEQRERQADLQTMAAQGLTIRTNDAATKAEGDALIAENHAADAASRAQVARAREARANANAKNQEGIAASRELAAGAFAKLNTELDASLRLSVEAYDRHPTAEARSGLLNSLQLHPYLERLLRTQDTSVNEVALTPDGDLLAWVSDAEIVFQNYRTGRQVGTPFRATIPGQGMGSIVVSPDGKHIAASTRFGVVTIWDVIGESGNRSMQPPREFNVSSPNLTGLGAPVVFGADGNTIVFGDSIATGRPGEGMRGLVFLDTASRKMDFRPSKLQSINCLALSPDGRTLAVGGGDEIELWDFSRRSVLPLPLSVATFRKQLVDIGPGLMDHFTGLSFSADGKTLASARQGDAVILWNVQSGDMIGEPLKGAGSRVAFDPRSQSNYLTTVGQSGALTLWDAGARPPKKVWTEVYSRGLSGLAFNGQDGTVVTGDTDGTIAFWKTEAGDKLGRLVTEQSANYLDFNREGDLILSVLNNGPVGDVRLWDFSAAGGEISPARRSPGAIKPSTFRPLTRPINQFGPDGKLLESWTRIYDLPDNGAATDLRIAYGAGGEFGRPAVSRNGRLLAALGANEVRLWDISDRSRPQFLFLLTPDRQESPTSAAFSHDGKLLVVGYFSGTVALYDLARPRQPKILRAAETFRSGAIFNNVMSVAVSDDGKIVASSGSETRLIYLWDVSTANPTLIGALGGALTQPEVAGANAWALAFSPDGTRLVSGNGGGIIVWDIDPLSWRERVCAEVSGSACSPPPLHQVLEIRHLRQQLP